MSNPMRWILLGLSAALILGALWSKHALDSYEPEEYVGPTLPPPAHIPHLHDTPDAIELRDLNGHTVRIGGPAAHPVLVHFWASWCLPCVGELPTFESEKAQFDAHGVTLLTVALDDSSHAREIVERLHLTLPVLLSDGAHVDPVMALGSAQGAVPYNALLDTHGALAFAKVGTADHGAAGLLKSLDAADH